MRAWIEDFTGENPEIGLTYEAVGSGEGNRRFLAENDERVDFAATEAPPASDELEATRGGGFAVPITAGSIVIAYNQAHTGLPNNLRLSREVYADIFLGDIYYWDHEKIQALNQDFELPHVPIIVVTRSDKSGTTFAFTSHLQAASKKWRERGLGAAKYIEWPRSGGDGRGNEDQAGAIKRTAGAIGYVQYGIAKRASLGMAVLENAAGKFVEPTAESFLVTLRENELPDDMRLTMPDPKGTDSYPLVTLAWALVPSDSAASQRNPEAIRFLKWCLEDGQQHAPDLGYAELPSEVTTQCLTALNEIR
jgi:phosphate transport system substrate-binding protein